MSLDIEIFSLAILVNAVKQEDSKVGVHPTRAPLQVLDSHMCTIEHHIQRFYRKNKKLGVIQELFIQLGEEKM